MSDAEQPDDESTEIDGVDETGEPDEPSLDASDDFDDESFDDDGGDVSDDIEDDSDGGLPAQIDLETSHQAATEIVDEVTKHS